MDTSTQIAQMSGDIGRIQPGEVVGRPFPKGVSGNPGGRYQTDHQLITALEAAVDKDALADKVVELAMAGDVTLIKYIYDRLAGPPVQRFEAKLLHQVGERAAELAKAYDLSPEEVRDRARQIAQGT